jgi:hypothetical protein
VLSKRGMRLNAVSDHENQVVVFLELPINKVARLMTHKLIISEKGNQALPILLDPGCDHLVLLIKVDCAFIEIIPLL